MKISVFLCILALFVFSSCTNELKKANQKLQGDMIAVHDEIMPFMGQFVKNSSEIDSILNNLQEVKTDHPDLDTLQVRNDLLSLKTDLNDANDQMDDWMHELTLDFEGKTEEEVQSYLKQEFENIEKIKDRFDIVQAKKQSQLDPILK